MTIYKVWLHIERIKGDQYHDVDEPVDLGEFRTIHAARKFVRKIVEHVRAPEIVDYWKREKIYPF